MINKDKIRLFLEQLGLCIVALFYVLFGWLEWWAGVAPRLIRGSEERNAIYHAHFSLGATLFALIVLLFITWLLKPGFSIKDKLAKAFSNSAYTAISLFFLFIFTTLIAGLGQAWGSNEEAKILSIFAIPHFFDMSAYTAGYLHSALSTIGVLLFSGMAFVFLYLKLKTYMKPGFAVALLLLVHLLINLPKPPSMHPIAAFSNYVMIPFFYLLALAVYTLANNKRLVYLPVYGIFIIFFMYLPYFAFKVLPPWHMSSNVEVVVAEPKKPLGKIRSSSEIFPNTESMEQAKKIVSWCMQCHNMKKSESHLLGPNLVGVFNRQAGTAEGYGRYSKAMTKSGIEGNFWSRENLSQFLTDGQNYISGNLMNQQTDFSDPEKLNAAIDYLEYLSTESKADNK